MPFFGSRITVSPKWERMYEVDLAEGAAADYFDDLEAVEGPSGGYLGLACLGLFHCGFYTICGE